jgi:hypothetical protein
MPNNNNKPTKIKTNSKKNTNVNVNIYVPKFDDLWNNHPKTKGIDRVCDEKNGKDKKGKDIYLYENQCAINMHYCLKNSGVNMDSFKGGICKHGLARGAQELANWLKNLKPFGDKVICNIYTGSDYKDNIANRTGIIFFSNYWKRPGEDEERRSGDHIDLFRDDEFLDLARLTNYRMISYSISAAFSSDVTSFSKSKEVWFWEIK